MTVEPLPEVKKVFSEIVEWRRHLHQHPELSFKEHNTAKYVAEKLHSFGNIEVFENVALTGVVGLIRGTKPVAEGKTPLCIGLRADMDALPIQELDSDRNKDYKSKNEGICHACGHDGHMAMLLGTAKVLSESRDSFSGTVKLVFQPAEEGYGGARVMVKEGVLEEGKFGPRVDQIYGIHLWNYLQFGQVGLRDGPLMASSAKFDIKITGKGGHGAVPEGTSDAIVAAASMVLQLQTIVARNVSPIDSAVLTVGSLHSGYNYNIIADVATMEGTVRTFRPETEQLVVKRMNEICEGISRSHDVKAELNYMYGYPCTNNKSKVHVENVRRASRKVVGEAGTLDIDPTMAAEDMAYFLLERDGAFFFVGSGPHATKDEILPHHKSVFDIDEQSLLVGPSIFIHLVRELMA